jgi:hypothetical protein
MSLLLILSAGEILKGWRIYPLQLDDLSPISYSSARGGSSDNKLRVPEQEMAQQLSRPAAEEVGPVFYR